MRFVRLLWITTIPGRAWVGSVSNKHNPSTESGLGACISSRITTVIHVMNDHQINYNCFNEPFAVSPYRSLYWDMHGLIFETSIWLLAGSTRFVHPVPLASSAQMRTPSAPEWWWAEEPEQKGHRRGMNQSWNQLIHQVNWIESTQINSQGIHCATQNQAQTNLPGKERCSQLNPWCVTRYLKTSSDSTRSQMRTRSAPEGWWASAASNLSQHTHT